MQRAGDAGSDVAGAELAGAVLAGAEGLADADALGAADVAEPDPGAVVVGCVCGALGPQAVSNSAAAPNAVVRNRPLNFC